MNFKIDLKSIPGKSQVRVVHVVGEIDEASLPEFKSELEKYLALEGVSIFIFYLRDLEFINSMVIGYLAGVFSKLRNEDKKMILAEGNEKILDIFELVGFLNLTEYHETLEQAIDSLEF
jgi:anti-anti-sigma factor